MKYRSHKNDKPKLKNGINRVQKVWLAGVYKLI